MWWVEKKSSLSVQKNKTYRALWRRYVLCAKSCWLHFAFQWCWHNLTFCKIHLSPSPCSLVASQSAFNLQSTVHNVFWVTLYLARSWPWWDGDLSLPRPFMTFGKNFIWRGLLLQTWKKLNTIWIIYSTLLLRAKLEKSNNVWQSNDEIEGGLDFNNGSYRMGD